MRKSKLFVFLLAAALALGSTRAHAGIVVPPPIIGGSSSGVGLGLASCVISIIIAAQDAARTENRELTTEEVLTCGLLYWINKAQKNT